MSSRLAVSSLPLDHVVQYVQSTVEKNIYNLLRFFFLIFQVSTFVSLNHFCSRCVRLWVPNRDRVEVRTVSRLFIENFDRSNRSEKTSEESAKIFKKEEEEAKAVIDFFVSLCSTRKKNSTWASRCTRRGYKVIGIAPVPRIKSHLPFNCLPFPYNLASYLLFRIEHEASSARFSRTIEPEPDQHHNKYTESLMRHRVRRSFRARQKATIMSNHMRMLKVREPNESQLRLDQRTLPWQSINNK